MAEHPIEGLMRTAMSNIKEMIDVNTIIGEPVETPDGNVIIPVSKLACGFAAGGSEFDTAKEGNGGEHGKEGEESGGDWPFGGGSGAGVSIQPVAFLIVGHGQTKLLPVNNSAVWDRLIDVAPNLVNQVQGMMHNDDNPDPNPVI